MPFKPEKQPRIETISLCFAGRDTRALFEVFALGTHALELRKGRFIVSDAVVAAIASPLAPTDIFAVAIAPAIDAARARTVVASAVGVERA